MQSYLLPENKDCPDMDLKLRQAVFDEKAGWYLHPELLGVSPADTVDLVFGRNGECVSLTDKQFDRRVPLVSVNIAREKNMVSEVVDKTLDEFIKWLDEELVEPESENTLMLWLHKRALDRIARGVEGQNIK